MARHGMVWYGMGGIVWYGLVGYGKTSLRSRAMNFLPIATALGAVTSNGFHF